MSVSPQWSLDTTAQSGINIARGVLQAATSDNVQPLAIMACERFGNTIAMSIETRRKMEHSVVPTPPPAVLGFLQVTVGFAANDSATYFGRSLAGLNFLGLVCTLVTVMDTFNSGLAVHAMLEESAADKTLLPTEKQVIELLKSIEPRCYKSCFATEVVGWNRLLKQTQTPRNLFAPQKGIVALVDAFRQISRIGETEVTRIVIETSISFAAWTAAFTKWCLGIPPCIAHADGTAGLDQPGSMVLINIIQDQDWRILTFRVTTHSSIGALSELVAGPGSSVSIFGMINLSTYGDLLLNELGLNHGNAKRAMEEAVPYALRQVLQKLEFWSNLFGEADANSKRPNYQTDKVCGQKLSPLPGERTVGMAYALLCSLSAPPDLRSLDPRTLITDLPQVRIHTQNVTSSSKDFLRRLAVLIADTLALSLYSTPNSLLVEHSHALSHTIPHDVGRIPPLSGLPSDIFSVLRSGKTQDIHCEKLLRHALRLTGHKKAHPFQGWLMMSSRGQTVWHTIFETNKYSNNGYLALSWFRGTIWFKKTSYDTCNSGPDYLVLNNGLNPNPTPSVAEEGVTRPVNYYADYRVHWDVALLPHMLEISIGLREKDEQVLLAARDPRMIMHNLANALMLNRCEHPSDTKLTEPDSAARFISPLIREEIDETIGDNAQENERESGRQRGRRRKRRRAPCGLNTINVVAVDGNDEMRFFALANSLEFPSPSPEHRPFVILRNEACLGCCLKLAREVGSKVVIL
ncbi:hypothetical protein QBC41DRAFT_35686 [Cercophora samala]|uniref:Uncharacterized protein n=1 Tax=Cercophora samala TaxID=330535 RepID=A0AA40D626_9PEZI|nr:hypothetical protein QBC41DRAFT_35686 [Cercophora samala]